MWAKLLEAKQIQVGKNFRQIVEDGNDHLETVFKILKVGQHYFLAHAMTFNGNEIPEINQIVCAYKIMHVEYYDFEIFTEL